LKPFKVGDIRAARRWFFRIASLIGIIAAIVAIGAFVRKGDTQSAGFLIFAVVACSVLFARSWTGSVFTLIESAKRHVAGVEGDHRHEWYAFKGQRVRVFLDANRQPWFALNEIAFILSINVDQRTFRHYGSHEYGTPESASENCLSESGLRRLIKHSAHPEAGALALWLEREVLRVIKNRIGSTSERKPP
jgi:hypothetical protein